MQINIDVPAWVSRYFSWALPKKILGLTRYAHVVSEDTERNWLLSHRVYRATDNKHVHTCVMCRRCGGTQEIASDEQEAVWREFHEHEEESHVSQCERGGNG